MMYCRVANRRHHPFLILLAMPSHRRVVLGSRVQRSAAQRAGGQEEEASHQYIAQHSTAQHSRYSKVSTAVKCCNCDATRRRRRGDNVTMIPKGDDTEVHVIMLYLCSWFGRPPSQKPKTKKTKKKKTKNKKQTKKNDKRRESIIIISGGEEPIHFMWARREHSTSNLILVDSVSLRDAPPQKLLRTYSRTRGMLNGLCVCMSWCVHRCV